jgi:hypothetical protein
LIGLWLGLGDTTLPVERTDDGSATDTNVVGELEIPDDDVGVGAGAGVDVDGEITVDDVVTEFPAFVLVLVVSTTAKVLFVGVFPLASTQVVVDFSFIGTTRYFGTGGQLTGFITTFSDSFVAVLGDVCSIFSTGGDVLLLFS